jgi:outer membrane protein TolC
MRLTPLGTRLLVAMTLYGGLAPMTGCRSTPYIERARELPRPPASADADPGVTPTSLEGPVEGEGPPDPADPRRDDQVEAAQYLRGSGAMGGAGLPLPLPKVAEPRTTSNPETQEVWRMTLQEAIRIGLDNSEVVRVIALGAQGIPVGGFEPVPLSTGTGGALGTGTLATVYDPAIQETQIATALSQFDANLLAQLNMQRSVLPFNNAFQAGFFRDARYPVVAISEGFSPQGGTPTAGVTLQKRFATGGTASVGHNIFWQYQNFTNQVYPSFWSTQTQLRFSQPLLGNSPNLGPSGLEANRAQIVISRLNADVSVWRFKSEIMSLVRSVEQQYWALAQQHIRLWAAQTAYDLSQTLLEDVVANMEVGSRRGSRRDLADAQVQVESAGLDLVTATSDVLTTERQLRNILGLPPADNRRIIPVSEPTDARLEPNWEASLAQMVSFQPDVVQNQLLVRVAEMQLLVARNQLLPALDFNVLYQLNGFGRSLDEAEAIGTGAMLRAINPLAQQAQTRAGLNPTPGDYNNFQSWQVGFNFQMPLGFRGPLANTRQAQLALLRQRAFLQQTVHQSTHALARFFLEVDANYKQYKAASRLKEASWVRLDYNKARYEVGDRDPSRSEEAVTIQQYIDSINRWTNAVAQEATYKSTYNTSIAVLEEAKGTLLGYNSIAIAEGPWPRKAYVQARDQQAAHRQHPIGDNGSYQPQFIQGPATPDPVAPMPPPGMNEGTRPPLPAPVGPVGPAPRSIPPQVPAGQPDSILSGLPAADPSVAPARATVEDRPARELPPLPMPAAEAPAGAEPPAGELPAIALPALPPE